MLVFVVLFLCEASNWTAMSLMDSDALMLLQSKTLSLNPAKKVSLTLRRAFGSEPSGLQPVAVNVAPLLESNDVPADEEAPAAESVISHPDEVHFLCI